MKRREIRCTLNAFFVLPSQVRQHFLLGRAQISVPSEAPVLLVALFHTMTFRLILHSRHIILDSLANSAVDLCVGHFLKARWRFL